MRKTFAKILGIMISCVLISQTMTVYAVTTQKDLKNKLDHLKYRTHMIESLQKNTLLCSCGNLMKCEYIYDSWKA